MAPMRYPSRLLIGGGHGAPPVHYQASFTDAGVVTKS
jgi:hypothetical protein